MGRSDFPPPLDDDVEPISPLHTRVYPNYFAWRRRIHDEDELALIDESFERLREADREILDDALAVMPYDGPLPVSRCILRIVLRIVESAGATADQRRSTFRLITDGV